MTEPERAYVGCAIDTDGHAALRIVNHRYLQWTIAVTGADLEIMSAMLRATGCGGIHLCCKKDSRGMLNVTKDCWRWYTSRKAEIINISLQCSAYSSKLQRVVAYFGL